MITRIKIDGFKNLVNVDIHLDTFVCIAGANAAGKSNLFDAIRFLSDLSHKPLMEAAKSVRSESQKAADIRDIFFKINGHYAEFIKFDVEMIIPSSAEDESGEKADASITTVQYELVLRYKKEEDEERIIIERESLKPIAQGNAKENLHFDNSFKWRKSVIKGRRTSDYISTYEKGDGKKMVRLHQDQIKGKPFDRVAAQLPRTVLSTASAEYPTACVVRQEMKSWMLLQLEPSAMRKSDDFDKRKNARLGADGTNLPATIFRLKAENPHQDIYQQLANRLSELVDNVDTIDIDKDEKRALLTLLLQFKGSAQLPARSLSDGTLRFLALAVLEADAKSGGIICLEEPENGIHPGKIPAVIRLLQDIACDTMRESDENNPFRQVIINTHSPLVVEEVPEDSLLVVTSKEYVHPILNARYKSADFCPLSDTWRTRKITDPIVKPVALGQLMAYLGANLKQNPERISLNGTPNKKRVRVIDRPDIQQQLTPF